MFGRIRDLLGISWVDVRILKQTRKELHSQDASHRAVHSRFRNPSLFDLIRQARVASDERQLDVNAGIQRESRRVFVVSNDVMNRTEFRDAEIVRDHDSLESPL